jgi:hypothetical protein
VLISYLGTNPALVQVEVSDGDLGYAFDDAKPLPAPERNESPLTRGTHLPIAARRLT